MERRSIPDLFRTDLFRAALASWAAACALLMTLWPLPGFGQEPSPETTAVESNTSGLKLYGYVDLSYTQNFNNPSDNINQLRIFDPDANSFRPHMAQVVLEKAGAAGRNPLDRAGFRAKLNFGLDSQFTGGIDADDDVDFQEVYAQYIVPIGNGLDIRFGRMNTLVGFEVIESPFNVNFSRSWMFGLGQPFTTTGVRATYQVTPEILVSVGGINSFTGATSDTNRGKSVEWLVSLTPTDRFGLTHYGIFGPEGNATGQPSLDRILVGGYATLKVMDQLSAVVEAYYANEEGTGTVSPAGNARWNGVAGYLIYDLSEQWGVRFRGEVFEDAGGIITCVPASGGTNTCFAPGAPLTLWEMTYTIQYKPVPSLITRLEFRYDKSDTDNVFRFGTRSANHQETLAFEAIYLF